MNSAPLMIRPCRPLTASHRATIFCGATFAFGIGRGSCPAAMPTRVRTAAHAPSGAKAEGEAPGWWRAMRQRRAAGRVRKRSGGFEHQRLAVDTSRHGRLCFNLERRCRPFSHSRVVSWRTQHHHPEDALVQTWPGAGADRGSEPVGVVRDDDCDATLVPVSIRSVPPQVGFGGRAEDAPAPCRAGCESWRRDK